MRPCRVNASAQAVLAMEGLGLAGVPGCLFWDCLDGAISGGQRGLAT